MCEIDGGESCEVWRETMHTARKSRGCDCCSALIAKGDKYLKHFSVFEGDATSEVMCSACAKARVEFHKEHGALMGGPSFFQELLMDCIADGPKSERKWKPVLDEIRERQPGRRPE